MLYYYLLSKSVLYLFLSIGDKSVKDYDSKRSGPLTDLSKQKDYIPIQTESETESMYDKYSVEEYCSEVNYDLEEEEVDEEFYLENNISYDTANSEDEKGDESAFQKPIDDEALKTRAFSTCLESLQVHLIF
jgi:hypothetical protein